MKQEIKELAKQAGFLLWSDEPWNSNNDVVDWSCSYDTELERFYELVVKKVESQHVVKR